MSNERTKINNQTIDLTRLRWRFVICSSSFYVNAIVWGFISSTGIFQNTFQTVYHLSSFQSTLPGSIQIATMSISSVFASILTLQYGVRSTTISGSLIATIGSILAAFIGRYSTFCVFYGLFVGIGEALMLVPSILAIPPYFHSNCVSLATATAVSGASIGMFGIPFLLKYLFDTYGLNGATLLSSCLWLSVALAASLFGKGVTNIEENFDDHHREKSSKDIVDHERNSTSNEQRYRSNLSTSAFIFTRRTSLLPSPTYFHYQEDISPVEHLIIVPSQNQDEITSNQSKPFGETSSLNSSPLIIKTPQIINSSISSTESNHLDRIESNSFEMIEKNKENKFYRNILVETCSLFRLKTFVLLIISMIFIWSFDETNFLFLSDLLKSTGQSEKRSTLLIAITGVADLVGQLFFGYLGDVECLDPFLLWTYSSIIAGLALSIAPWMSTFGIIPLSLVFALHAFFLAAPNALGNVMMIDVVGIHRYAMAYGFSLLVSGSTSFFGYPFLGFLKDKTGGWTIPFATVGIVMIIGGLIIGFVPLYRHYQKKRRKTT